MSAISAPADPDVSYRGATLIAVFANSSTRSWTNNETPELVQKPAHSAKVQHERFKLPRFPTTTIGSFPQTAEVRNARAAHARGALSDAAYNMFLQNQTARTVRWQENIGLDVLVHGEFERIGGRRSFVVSIGITPAWTNPFEPPFVPGLLIHGRDS